MPGQCFLNAGAYVLWYGFSPWTPAFRQRKGQVRTRIPEQDRTHGFGFNHFVEDDVFDRLWRELVPLAEDVTPKLR
jgi:hypothetical protein